MKIRNERDRVLGRRVFMKALSLGIAAPLALRMGGMAIAGPSPVPVRLFVFFVPHGQPVEHFEPFGSGSDFLAGSDILAPIAPFKSYVNVVRGLSMNGAEGHGAIRSALTGALDGEGADSIDYTIAQSLGLDTHALGAIPYDRPVGFGWDSFLVKHGSWVRPTEDPSVAAAELLGGAAPADPNQLDESAFRKETLSLTERQLERMHGALNGLTREQSKLSLHIDAVRALKASGDRPVVNGCGAQPVLSAVDALKGADVLAYENFGRVVDAHLEVAANAMVCGTSRVITMQSLWSNSALTFDFPGGPGIARAHHDPLSHSWDAPGRADFARCQRWFYERIAEKLLRVLDQPDPLDPGNTVLHNSMIYVCSEVADGANHNSTASEIWFGSEQRLTYLPAVLIGRGGGYLAQKEVVTVSRLHTDLLATLAQGMGVNLPTINGQTVNPIQELRT